MQNLKCILSIYIRKLKIGTRFFLFQVLAIVIISFCTIFYVRLNISRIFDRYINQYLQSEQKIVADNLSMYLEEFVMLSLRYKNTEDFYDILKNPELSEPERAAALKETASAIQPLVFRSVAGAYLLDYDQHIYLLNGAFSLPQPDPSITEQISDSPYYHIGKVCHDADGNYYIPVGMRFYNFYTFQEIGTLLFYLPQESIVSVFDELFPGSGITLLTDADGIILAHSDTSYIGKSIGDLGIQLSAPYSAVQQTTIDGQDSFVAITSLGKASSRIGFSWRLITILPCNVLYDTLQQLQRLLMLFASLIVLVAALLSFHLSKRLTGSIKRLSNKLRNLGEHTLNSFLDQTPRDELWDLEQGYNEMIVRINELLEKNKQEQIKKRELEFTALQAQINPHFLYNTLDTIGWIAALKNQPEIEQMVMELSRFFRLSLHKGDLFIPLADELGIVSSYLNIEQLRNPGKFDVSYDIQPDLMQIMMPKLILQPLVENAVKHGVSQTSRHGLITIRGYHIKDDIYLEVTDNGLGIQNKETQLPRSGYGLRNIRERIQLEYGKDYGLTIDSREQEGTTVQIHIHF